MITGVEFDFVVKDSLAALEDYQAIFDDLKVVEATQYQQGLNEVVFTLYDVRFHLMDENPEYGLLAPHEGSPQSFWFNITVPDINKTYQQALDRGVTEIQGINHLEEMGVSNAIFADQYGYVWMLHQIHKIISFEERTAHLENQNNPQD